MNMNMDWQGAEAQREKSENEMMRVERGTAVPGKARVLGGELVTLLMQGMESGDADFGVPEEMDRLVQMGAGVEELLDALREAAKKGRISPLLLVQAEKVLGAGAGDEEMTDRDKVLSRGGRNKLRF